MPERKLTELDPAWVAEDGQRVGVSFECPADDGAHGIGVPFVKCDWSEGNDSKAVWQKTGETFEDLSLSPSIDCTKSGYCKFHGWVKNGIVSW